MFVKLDILSGLDEIQVCVVISERQDVRYADVDAYGL